MPADLPPDFDAGFGGADLGAEAFGPEDFGAGDEGADFGRAGVLRVRGCPVRGEVPVPEPVSGRVSRRMAVRARERRERLEKGITPRYYVLRFQCGQAFVGDC